MGWGKIRNYTVASFNVFRYLSTVYKTGSDRGAAKRTVGCRPGSRVVGIRMTSYLQKRGKIETPIEWKENICS